MNLFMGFLLFAFVINGRNPSRRAPMLAGQGLIWTRMKSAQRCVRPGRRGSSTAGLLLPGQSLCRSHGGISPASRTGGCTGVSGGYAEAYLRLPRAAISSPGHVDPAIYSGPLRLAALSRASQVSTILGGACCCDQTLHDGGLEGELVLTSSYIQLKNI